MGQTASYNHPRDDLSKKPSITYYLVIVGLDTKFTVCDYYFGPTTANSVAYDLSKKCPYHPVHVYQISDNDFSYLHDTYIWPDIDVNLLDKLASLYSGYYNGEPI